MSLRTGFPLWQMRAGRSPWAVRLALAMVAGLVLGAWIPGAPEAEAAFADVSGHWAETEITMLHANGVLSGYPGGSFRPEARVTRAELVKMVVEALRLGAEARRMAGASLVPLYGDVRADDWYVPYMIVAVERGLIRGYDDDTFGGERPVTRAEIAVILHRALPPMEHSWAGSFVDGDDIPPWASEQVAALVGLGMIRGYGDGSFRPSEGATRAEVAVMVCRLLAWRGDLVQMRGVINGWVVRDREGDIVPEAALVTADGIAEMRIAVHPSFSVLSGHGPAGWRSLRAGQDVGLVLSDEGTMRLIVCRLDGETLDLLDPRSFLRPPGGGDR